MKRNINRNLQIVKFSMLLKFGVLKYWCTLTLSKKKGILFFYFLHLHSIKYSSYETDSAFTSHYYVRRVSFVHKQKHFLVRLTWDNNLLANARVTSPQGSPVRLKLVGELQEVFKF